MNINKLSKLSGISLKNGIRLHKDSILLFKKASYASALACSIFAQEEIGKAWIFHHFVYQEYANETSEDIKEYNQMIISMILSHKIKQGWFSKYADDLFQYGDNRFPRFYKEMRTGKIDEMKQNAIYVGLTKKAGKVDLKGRIIDPVKKVKSDYVDHHITRVNDFLIVFSEGNERGVYGIDTEEMDEIFTLNLVEELERLWPKQQKTTQSKLKKFRMYSIDHD